MPITITDTRIVTITLDHHTAFELNLDLIRTLNCVNLYGDKEAIETITDFSSKLNKALYREEPKP